MLNDEQKWNFIKDLESRVIELEMIKNPSNVVGQIQGLFDSMETLTKGITDIKTKILSYDLDERYLEIFTNEDLKTLYNNSGRGAIDVKIFIQKYIYNGEDVSLSTVSRYVNGEIEDLQIRSKLGKYFRNAALKNSK